MPKLSSIQSFLWPHLELIGHILLLLLIYGGFWNLPKDLIAGAELSSETIIVSIALPVVPTILFYLNAFWLIPVWLRKGKWLPYLLMLLGVLCLFQGILELAFIWTSPASDTRSIWQQFIQHDYLLTPVITGLTFSFGYAFTKDWILNNRLIEKLEAEKSAMELAFLKSQVDPHFLFNTLNTLYGMALEEESSNTAEGIAQLGTLMRYNLHDSQADQILLTKEIDYIRKYIALQQLRITGQNEIVFEVDITEGSREQVRIAPMLLIPFVENAFKYGISPTEKTRICATLVVRDNRLIMDMGNSIIAQPSETENGGVGLENVRNRLELLYPDQHLLRCGTSGNTFSVHLEIHLA